MRLLGQLLLVLLISLLFVPVLLWLVVELWIAYPPQADLVPAKAAAMARIWQNMGLNGFGYLVGFYRDIMVGVWPLWLVGFLGVAVAVVLMLISRLQQQAGPYLKRIHQLEAHLSQATREQRMTQEQLQTYNTRLIASYAESRTGLIELAPSGQIVQLNKAAMRLLHKWSGTTEPLEQKVLQLVLPDYANTALATAVHNSLAEGAAWEGEVTLPSLQAHAYSRVFPSVGGAFMTLRDISHKYQDESAVYADQAALSALLNNMPLPAAVLDQDWCYLRVSKAWGQQFRIAEDHVEGQYHFDHMASFPRAREELEQLVQSKQAQGEEPLKFGDQEEWYRWQVTPWRDQASNRGGYILSAEVITEQAQTKNRLASQLQQEHKLAYHDVLTGLPNRQLFYDRLNLGLAQAYRQLSRVGLMFLDLDGFKSVNDTHGHDAGDILLKEVSERLKSCVRKTDTVARLGGDEFTIILSAVRSAEDVVMVANKVIERINLPYPIMDKELHVGTSIGIAMYPDDGASAGDLLTLADEAMYDAKHSGKNQYRFISELKEKQQAEGGKAEPEQVDPTERRAPVEEEQKKEAEKKSV